MQALVSALSNPAVQALVKQGATHVGQQIKRRRVRRSRNNQWVMGKRLGLGPTIQAPVAASRQYTNRNPAGQVITGTEIVLTLAASTNAYGVQFMEINPAHAGYFPRLSNILLNYQRWKMESLIFDYLPLVPTSTAGQIGFAMVCDPSASTPTSLEEFMCLNGANMTNVWQASRLPCPAAVMNRLSSEYLSNIGADGDTDAAARRQTSAGLIVAATNAVAAGTHPGQLRATYRVRLLDPCLNAEASPTSVMLQATNGLAGTILEMSEPGYCALQQRYDSSGAYYAKSMIQPVMLISLSQTTGGPYSPPNLYTLDGGTETILPPKRSFTTTSLLVNIWHIPSGRAFYRLRAGTLGTESCCCVIANTRTAFDYATIPAAFA